MDVQTRIVSYVCEDPQVVKLPGMLDYAGGSDCRTSSLSPLVIGYPRDKMRKFRISA